MKSKLLVVDDDPMITELFEDFFKETEVEVVSFNSGRKALSYFNNNDDVDFVLTDIIMPGGVDGFKLIEKVRSINPEVIIFAMTGDEDAVNKIQYESIDEVYSDIEVFEKPLNPQDVVERVLEELQIKEVA